MLCKIIFIAMLAVLFSRAEPVGQFCQLSYKKHLCEIILNFDQWFREICRLKIFLSKAFVVISFSGAERFVQF